MDTACSAIHAGCYCVPEIGSEVGYCTDASGSYKLCSQDSDCPSGEQCFDACTTGVCLNVANCANSASPARMFARGYRPSMAKGFKIVT